MAELGRFRRVAAGTRGAWRAFVQRARLVVGVAAVATAALGFLAWQHVHSSWSRNETCKSFDACEARCEAGAMSACYEAGVALDDGAYVPRDPQRAAALFEKACSGGRSRACDPLALRLKRDGRETEARSMRQRGFEVAKSGCERGNLDECYALFFDLKLGWDQTTKDGQDEKAATLLANRIQPEYARLCEHGEADACLVAARFLTSFENEPSKAAIERALPLYVRACELDASTCWSAGNAHRELGRDGRQFFEKACDTDDDGSSCWNPGDVADPALSAKRLAKDEEACRAGKREACIELVSDRSGTLTKSPATPEQERAHTAWVRAMLGAECELGMGDSCSQLAALLAFDEKGQLASGPVLLEIALLKEKACAAGYKSGCDEAAIEPLLKDVSAVFTGTYHHCARKNDGRLVCWGSNSGGVFGLPVEETSWKLVPMRLDTRAVDMALGSGYTCVLDENGLVACWGEWFHGPRTPSPVPRLVDELSGAGARRLKANDRFLCAELAGDKVVCVDNLSQFKTRRYDAKRVALGKDLACFENASGLSCLHQRDSNDTLHDVRVSPTGGELAIGDRGVCSLLPGGKVACEEVRLVDLDGPNSRIGLKPVPTIEDAVELSLSGDHGCARLKAGGVSCWELPDGQPKAIEGIDDAVQLTNSCATTKRGYAFCWGGRYLVPWGTPEPMRISPAVSGTL